MVVNGASVLQIECTTHLSSATPSKVTWIQWLLWGEKVSLHVHEKLKEHLVLKLCGERDKCATNWIIHLSSATPSKVTWIPWLLWSEKVSHYCMKSLRTIRSSNRASVLQIELYYSPVKCHHVSLMTRGVLHGKSKEHLVCNVLWCMAWQAVNSTCLFNSSVVHYSSPPDWAIWSWTNTR